MGATRLGPGGIADGASESCPLTCRIAGSTRAAPWARQLDQPTAHACDERVLDRPAPATHGRYARMVPRRRTIATAGCILVCAAGAGVTVVAIASQAASSYQPSYDDHNKVNPALKATMRRFAATMSRDPSSAWLYMHTVKGEEPRMRRFLAGYGGRPVDHDVNTIFGDQEVTQTVTIRCSSTTQPVDLVWHWTDGTWRSQPGYATSASDQTRDYPGCS